MAKTTDIQLGDGTRIPILHEDRAVMAIDKPPRWMLVPGTWNRTPWNLQLAIESALLGGAFWAKCRHLRFLRYVHRLDAETSGVLLLAKNTGSLRRFTEMFERREVEKSYLAVVAGVPRNQEWTCNLRIGRDPRVTGRMKIDGEEPRDACTHFRVLEASQSSTLVLAQPETGRTHQIRVHLTACGHPILGDILYPGERRPTLETAATTALALRAVRLAYLDPFTRRPVQIEAPSTRFLRQHGFGKGDHAGPPPSSPARHGK